MPEPIPAYAVLANAHSEELSDRAPGMIHLILGQGDPAIMFMPDVPPPLVLDVKGAGAVVVEYRRASDDVPIFRSEWRSVLVGDQVTAIEVIAGA